MLGTDSIGDVDGVRCGGLNTLFDGVYVPSMIGTLLREFTFAHAQQLESVLVRLRAPPNKLRNGKVVLRYRHLRRREETSPISVHCRDQRPLHAPVSTTFLVAVEPDAETRPPRRLSRPLL